VGNVSIKPSSFVEGGALLDDVNLVIQRARFILGDYDGKMMEKVPMLDLLVATEDGEEHHQFYSVGGSSDFAPDDTGKGLNKIGSKSSLTKSSNFALFMAALVEAGFDEGKVDDNDISFLEGVRAHFLRKAVKREGLENKKGKDNTVLVIDKLLEAKKSAGKGKAATGSAKSAAKADDGELREDVAALLLEVLSEQDNSAIAKKNILGKILPRIKDNPAKKDIIALATNDEFIGSREEWTYAEGILTLA
jgi:hypothetical protein